MTGALKPFWPRIFFSWPQKSDEERIKGKIMLVFLTNIFFFERSVFLFYPL